MAERFTPAEIARELADYKLQLTGPALHQLAAYLELLLRWNRHINLTAVKEPRHAVRELFAESLYLSKVLPLQGHLVDAGTGAGFPGLALKLVAPELTVTLVESNRRKCVFLQEVVRTCAFAGVAVVTARFEDWAEANSETADITTTRAVDSSPKFVDALARSARPGGHCAVCTTVEDACLIRAKSVAWRWEQEVAIPNTTNRVILLGETF